MARALRDGAVVTTIERAAAATSLAEPGGVAEVRVIGGPDAGTVHRLEAGRHHDRFRGGPAVQVRLLTPGVPAARGATVTVAWGLSEPSLEPAGAPAPKLMLDGRPVTGACPWPFGGVLRIATTTLQLMRPEAPDAHLSPVGGGLAYHRPPRFRPDMKPVKIGVPAEPRKGHSSAATMLLSAAVPMAMGGVMVYLTRQWIYSLFMLMSPLMVLGYWASGRKQRGGAEGSHRRKMRAYAKQMAEVEANLVQTKAADEKRRREDAMDPAQVLLTATGPRRRLWERRADDPDTLRMRIGLFDGPAMIQLVTPKARPRRPPVPTAFCVPVSMRLTTTGVLGLAEAGRRPRALARWKVAQSAVLHSPRDLSIVVLVADPAAGQHWNWVRWLPHCAPRGSEDCVALVGTDLGVGVDVGRRGSWSPKGHRAAGEGPSAKRRGGRRRRRGRIGGRQRPGAEDPGRAGRGAAAAPDPRHAAAARQRPQDRHLRGLHRRGGAGAAGGLRRGAVLGHPRAGKRQPPRRAGRGLLRGWSVAAHTAPRRRRCGRS